MAKDNITIAIDGTKAKRFVQEIERHHDTLETFKGEHMSRCKSVRELISENYDLAADAGINKKALKAFVKARALKRKLTDTRADLEEGVETFDMIAAAIGEDFGGLPLGQAALNRAAETRAENGAALDDLTDPDSDGDGDDEQDVKAPRARGRKAKDPEAAAVTY